MNANQPTPSLTWDWHYAAFGVRPRFTISWVFACGLIAAGAAQIGRSASPVMLIAAWLVADPLLGAVTTHLLALRNIRNRLRAASETAESKRRVFVFSTERNSPGSELAAFYGRLRDNLHAFPELAGHSLSALATAVACLVMSIFISPIATATVAAGLLWLAWAAILTGDGSHAYTDLAGGMQTSAAFLLAITAMNAFTWQLVLVSCLLGIGTATRSGWIRTGSRALHLGSSVAWLAITMCLLYTRQPVPAVLVACAAIADHLCQRENPEQAAGFLAIQLPWLVTLLLVGLAASQWA